MCGCPRHRARVHPHILWALALLTLDLALLVLAVGLLAIRNLHL